MSGSEGSSGHSGGAPAKKKDKAKVSRTSLILWHAHQNDAAAVKKLLDEDGSLVNARDYDNRTPLHVASLHGWIDVAKCLIEYGADVNAQDRWKNTPLADAEGAKKRNMIELLKLHDGKSLGQNGSHSEPKPVLPPLSNKCDWEIDPVELDFTSAHIVGKGSFGEIVKASWRGTPVAVKRILPSLSDDRFVVQDFRHEVNLLVKLRHPNIVQFLGAVTEKKPLMLVTEFLRGASLQAISGESSSSGSVDDVADFSNDDYSQVKGPEKSGYIRCVGRMPAVKKVASSRKDPDPTMEELKNVMGVMGAMIHQHYPNSNLLEVLNKMNIKIPSCNSSAESHNVSG